MKQLFLCHLITFLCFLVYSQTQLHFFCFICHLFWDNQMSENRRRFVSRTFSVVNGSFPLFWILPWKNAAGPA